MKQKKKIPSIRKYDDGYFVDPKNRESIGAVDQYASSLLSIGQNPRRVNTGLSTAQGALSGAAQGFAIAGPWGAAVGGVAGGVSSLIGASGKKRAEEQLDKDYNNTGMARFADQTKTNVDPYGTQMYAYGDFIEDPIKGKKNINKLAPTYDPSLLMDGSDKFMVTKKNGNLGQWGNDIIPSTPINLPSIRPSEKQLGVNNTYYPSNSNSVLPTPTIIPAGTSTYGHYKYGGNIGMNGKFNFPQAGLGHFAPHMNHPMGKINPFKNNIVRFEDGGGIHIKPSHEGRFTAYKERTGETTEEALHSSNPHVRQMANFARNAASWHHEDGDFVQGDNPNNTPEDSTPTNTQQNIINIQKGELLIHPETGKVLQEFTGINPLTGGMFEDHAKKQKNESSNNFTMADPGLFVITKKTAKQYKKALDNNDKISQKTVLMNIRNAKIAKDGGLKNYAFGDTVEDPNNPVPYTNMQTWNPITTPRNLYPGPVNYNLGVAQALTNASFNTPTNLTGYQAPRPLNTSVQSNSSTGNNIVGNIVDGVNKYGPALYNIGRGLFGNVDHQAYGKPIVNPYTQDIIANMPKNIDMQPIINDIHENQNLADRNIYNNTNNAAVYRANKQVLTTNANKQLTNARLQAQEANNQSAGQRAYMYNALGYQDQQQQAALRQYNFGVDDINARRQGAKEELLNTGLSQLQQVTMNDKANKQKAGTDKASIDMLRQIFPNTRFYDNFDYDKLLKGIKG
jgi:hypothetical protein